MTKKNYTGEAPQNLGSAKDLMGTHNENIKTIAINSQTNPQNPSKNDIKVTGQLTARYFNNATKVIIDGKAGEFDLGNGVKFSLTGTAAINRNYTTGKVTIEVGAGGILSFGTDPKFTVSGEAIFNLNTGNITLKPGSSITIGNLTLTGQFTYNTLSGKLTDQFGVSYDVSKQVKFMAGTGTTDGTWAGVQWKINKNIAIQTGYNFRNEDPFVSLTFPIGSGGSTLQISAGSILGTEIVNKKSFAAFLKIPI
ncbi:MAG: hypothetical protein ACK53K_04695 [Burkholderiales bacterium]